MVDESTNRRLIVELRNLRARICELEGRMQLSAATLGSSPTSPLSPAVWRQEIFPAQITADNQDGTYQAKRLIATGANSFTDDSDDTTQITIGNVSERGGYTGELTSGDVVLVRFDGMTSQSAAIYHVW